MTWAYRNIKIEYDSDEEQEIGFRPGSNSQLGMEPALLKALIEGAVNSALLEQERRLKDEFRAELETVRGQVNALRIETPQVETYQRVTIDPSVGCEVKLDIVKSVPNFNGNHEEYVSWRQAAIDAYEIFKRYVGSEAHYEAVAILKNKVTGPARAILTSHNTVLNFDAIIARLDCSYADKTSLRVLRQQLELVRQGDLNLMEYYDEVEKKLTLVTNKIVMTHDEQAASILCAEIRDDALHAFMAGLRRPLKSLVIPAKPKDLPSALAVAREAENSIERSAFAASYAKVIEERNHSGDNTRFGNRNQARQGRGQERNPHFVGNQGQSRAQQADPKTLANDKEPQSKYQAQPMDVDPSMSKLRQQTNWGKPQGYSTQDGARKRHNTSERTSGYRRQKINNITQRAPTQDEKEYEEMAETARAEIDDESGEPEDNDLLNFLEIVPDCRSSSVNWLAKH